MGSVFSVISLLSDEQKTVLAKLRRPCACKTRQPCREAAESMISLGLVEVASGELQLTGLGKRVADGLS
ncbi:MAG: hypothetical protein AAFU72_01900 [Pseudomonadota bacterium]